MRTSSLLLIAAGLLGSAAVLVPTYAANTSDEERVEIPNFNPDGRTGWGSNRGTSDDFLPPKNGPGPVLSDPKHPYIPNQSAENSTYRVADLTNPILQEWTKEPMKKANDAVLAGKVPFIARERCWPIGVPGFVIWNRGQPLRFIQTKNEVWMINELFGITRRVYLNVPHTANPKPSCSSSYQAAPMPRMARPFEMTSSVVTIFASNAGVMVLMTAKQLHEMPSCFSIRRSQSSLTHFLFRVIVSSQNVISRAP